MSRNKSKTQKISYVFIAKSLPVVILLFIVICAIIYKVESTKQEDAAKMIGSDAVEQTSSVLKNWIDDQVRIAQMIAANKAVIKALQSPDNAFSVDQAHDYLQSIHERFPYYENLPLSLKLAEGETLEIQVGEEQKIIKNGAFITDTVGGKTIGKCNSTFSYIKAINEGKEFFISQVYPSLLRGNPIFVISAPVKDKEGKLLGAAIVAPQMSYFTELFVDKLKVGETGYLFFVDDRGMLIAHPDKKMILNKDAVKTIKPITSKIFASSSHDISFQENFKGKEKFYTATKVDIAKGNILHGWFLVFTQEMDDIHSSSAYFLKLLIWLALAFVVVYSLVIIVLTRGLTKPINAVSSALHALSIGDLSKKIDYSSNNELGQMADACRDMIAANKKNAETLTAVANGDWTVDVEVRSEQDSLRMALKKLIADVGNALREVNSVAQQVNSRSSQIEDASQVLSQGATQTAAALEEINSSINEMASQTKQSADNANQANQLTDDVSQSADKGREQMQSMMSAMTDINESGQNISKIIKVIDEIAFQTNLLALNAAVEAARAGQHGKGFAVVAEEVRNLAARSAKAAEETSQLIENSVAKTENGSKIAQHTAEALEDIIAGIAKASALVSEIAAASNEQAQGIEQVTQGLGQIDQGVQQSTATAEESASASQELSAQAAQLQQMLEQFTLAGNQAYQMNMPASEPPLTPSQPAPSIGWGKQPNLQLDDDEFGKF